MSLLRRLFSKPPRLRPPRRTLTQQVSDRTQLETARQQLRHIDAEIDTYLARRGHG